MPRKKSTKAEQKTAVKTQVNESAVDSQGSAESNDAE